MQQGIAMEKAKEIVKLVKDSKKKGAGFDQATCARQQQGPRTPCISRSRMPLEGPTNFGIVSSFIQFQERIN